jgi:hypothetical protein
MARALQRRRNNKEEQSQRQEYDRPEGDFLAYVGTEDDPKKYSLFAEMSDFTGEPELDIRKWVKLKNGKWTRTGKGVRVPQDKMEVFAKKLVAFIKKQGGES